MDPDAAVWEEGARAGSSCSEIGRATAPHEVDGVVQIDFDVRREDGRCVEVVPGPAERVEPPREDLGCLVDLEPFELCRRHALPPLERIVRCWRPSIAMAVTSSEPAPEDFPRGARCA